jgi:hypothetical protein
MQNVAFEVVMLGHDQVRRVYVNTLEPVTIGVQKANVPALMCNAEIADPCENAHTTA